MRRSLRTEAGGGGAAHRSPAASQAGLAAVSGLVFAALTGAAMLLVHRIPGLAAPDDEYRAFYSSGDRGSLVILGLYIVPFAGIACIWHMIATRTMLQVLRPSSWSQVQHWLNLASGVLFVCLMFAGSAAVGAVALLTRFSGAPLPGPDVARALSAVGYAMVFVYGVRAAAMYMITTTGLARSAGVLPTSLAVVSYLAAAFLLLSTTFHPAILLVFPGWVVLVSVLLLIRRPAGGPP